MFREIGNTRGATNALERIDGFSLLIGVGWCIRLDDNLHLLMLAEIKFTQRLQHAVFIDGLNYVFHRSTFINNL